MRYSLLVLSITIAAAFMPVLVAAEPTTCVTNCDDRYTVCSAGAHADLTACLSTARTGHEKEVCGAAYVAAQQTCRTDEATCVGACTD